MQFVTAKSYHFSQLPATVRAALFRVRTRVFVLMTLLPRADISATATSPGMSARSVTRLRGQLGFPTCSL
jgi:hypothetical protein